MNKLILLSLLFASAVCADPWLAWTGSTGATGYRVSCGTTPLGAVTPVDVAAALTYDLGLIPVVNGTEYECFVVAYNAEVTSPESDHLVFTPLDAPQVINFPAAPSSITITW